MGGGAGEKAINKQANNKQEATKKKPTASGIQMRQALKYNTINPSISQAETSINLSIYLSM